MKRHCEKCDEDTEHSEEVVRDASVPPEGMDEGWCSPEAVSFYMNGDSVYRVTCLQCGYSFEDM